MAISLRKEKYSLLLGQSAKKIKNKKCEHSTSIKSCNFIELMTSLRIHPALLVRNDESLKTQKVE